VRALLQQRLDQIAVRWGLPQGSAALLADRVAGCSFAPGETILPYGVQAGFLGVVASGRAAAYADHRQDARQVAVLLPGSAFGHDMLASNQPSPVAIRALTCCMVWILDRSEVEALIHRLKAQRKAYRRWGLVAGSGIIFLLLSAGLLFFVDRALSALLTAWAPQVTAWFLPLETGYGFAAGREPLAYMLLGGLALVGVVLLAVGLVARRKAKVWI
jgi:CRP-like cAMP-binding protein